MVPRRHILGGDPRKAAGKSQGVREMRKGGCGKGKSGNGKKDGGNESCRRVRRPSAQKRKGNQGVCRGEEARLGAEEGRRSEERQVVEELRTEDSSDPFRVCYPKR